MKILTLSVLAALGCGGAAMSATYASASVDLTISALNGPGLLIDSGAEPVASSAATAGGGTADVIDSLAFGHSILTASAGADGVGASGAAGGRLVRTVSLFNPLPWLVPFGARVDYLLAASVFADGPEDIGAAFASLRITRTTTTAAGAVSSYDIVPTRTLSLDQDDNGLETYPDSGPTAFVFVLQVQPGDRDELSFESLVSAEASSDAAPIPAPVPLPMPAGLLAAGLGGILLVRRRPSA